MTYIDRPDGVPTYMMIEQGRVRPQILQDSGQLAAVINGFESEWRVYVSGATFYVQQWPLGGFADEAIRAVQERRVDMFYGGNPLEMWRLAMDLAMRKAYEEIEEMQLRL